VEQRDGHAVHQWLQCGCYIVRLDEQRLLPIEAVNRSTEASSTPTQPAGRASGAFSPPHFAHKRGFARIFEKLCGARWFCHAPRAALFDNLQAFVNDPRRLGGLFPVMGAEFVAQPRQESHAKAERHTHRHDKQSPQIQIRIRHKKGSMPGCGGNCK
jgi:hypothetical protein